MTFVKQVGNYLQPRQLDVVALGEVAKFINGKYEGYAKAKYIRYYDLFAYLRLGVARKGISGMKQDMSNMLRIWEHINFDKRAGGDIPESLVLNLVEKFGRSNAERALVSHALATNEFESLRFVEPQSGGSDAETAYGLDRPEESKLVDQLEELLFKYCDATQKARIFLVFAGDEAFHGSLSFSAEKVGAKVYQKDFTLSSTGLKRLVETAYSMNTWKWSLSFIDQISKGKSRGSNAPHSARILVYEPFDVENIRTNTLRIRQELSNEGFPGENLHGSDFWGDTQPVLEFVLSSETVQFANASPIGSEKKLMARLLNELKASKIYDSRNHILIAGSSILEIYGLRTAGDTDFISLEDSSYAVAPSSWDCRNRIYSQRQIWEMFHWNHHVNIQGLKFQTLAKYAELQEQRKLTSTGRLDFLLAKSQLGTAPPPNVIRLRVEGLLIFRQIKWGAKVGTMRILGRLGSISPEWIRKPVRGLASKIGL